MLLVAAHVLTVVRASMASTCTPVSVRRPSLVPTARRLCGHVTSDHASTVRPALTTWPIRRWCWRWHQPEMRQRLLTSATTATARLGTPARGVRTLSTGAMDLTRRAAMGQPAARWGESLSAVVLRDGLGLSVTLWMCLVPSLKLLVSLLLYFQSAFVLFCSFVGTMALAAQLLSDCFSAFMPSPVMWTRGIMLSVCLSVYLSMAIFVTAVTRECLKTNQHNLAKLLSRKLRWAV